MTMVAAQPGLQIRTLGVVSFLNARPLVSSLSGAPDVAIIPDVPARLAMRLDAGECDAALLPIVDYWRARDQLERVSDACIASDGETLTVRVFSRVPPDRVCRVHADVHSHTSVMLSQVVWREMYGHQIEVAPYDHDRPDADPSEKIEAVLLIGDKVICNAPRGFGFEVDLGAAWKHLTRLPFVFAAWYAPKGRERRNLVETLESARDAGVANAARIAREAAPLHGWPEAIAVRYLCEIMRYRLTDDMLRSMELFFAALDRYRLQWI